MESYPIRRRPEYISDNTAFMRWSTEFENTKDIRGIDKNFFKRFYHKILGINKFPALSNIRSARQLKLIRCRINNADLAHDGEIEDLAIGTVLDNLNDYQISRGIEGFYQKALITQRREFTDRTPPERRSGVFKNLIRGRREEDKARYAEGLEE